MKRFIPILRMFSLFLLVCLFALSGRAAAPKIFSVGSLVPNKLFYMSGGRLYFTDYSTSGRMTQFQLDDTPSI